MGTLANDVTWSMDLSHSLSRMDNNRNFREDRIKSRSDENIYSIASKSDDFPFDSARDRATIADCRELSMMEDQSVEVDSQNRYASRLHLATTQVLDAGDCDKVDSNVCGNAAAMLLNAADNTLDRYYEQPGISATRANKHTSELISTINDIAALQQMNNYAQDNLCYSGYTNTRTYPGGNVHVKDTPDYLSSRDDNCNATVGLSDLLPTSQQLEAPSQEECHNTQLDTSYKVRNIQTELGYNTKGEVVHTGFILTEERQTEGLQPPKPPLQEVDELLAEYARRQEARRILQERQRDQDESHKPVLVTVLDRPNNGTLYLDNTAQSESDEGVYPMMRYDKMTDLSVSSDPTTSNDIDDILNQTLETIAEESDEDLSHSVLHAGSECVLTTSCQIVESTSGSQLADSVEAEPRSSFTSLTSTPTSTDKFVHTQGGFVLHERTSSTNNPNWETQLNTELANSEILSESDYTLIRSDSDINMHKSSQNPPHFNPPVEFPDVKESSSSERISDQKWYEECDLEDLPPSPIRIQWNQVAEGLYRPSLVESEALSGSSSTLCAEDADNISSLCDEQVQERVEDTQGVPNDEHNTRSDTDGTRQDTKLESPSTTSGSYHGSFQNERKSRTSISSKEGVREPFCKINKVNSQTDWDSIELQGELTESVVLSDYVSDTASVASDCADTSDIMDQRDSNEQIEYNFANLSARSDETLGVPEEFLDATVSTPRGTYDDFQYNDHDTEAPYPDTHNEEIETTLPSQADLCDTGYFSRSQDRDSEIESTSSPPISGEILFEDLCEEDEPLEGEPDKSTDANAETTNSPAQETTENNTEEVNLAKLETKETEKDTLAPLQQRRFESKSDKPLIRRSSSDRLTLRPFTQASQYESSSGESVHEPHGDVESINTPWYEQPLTTPPIKPQNKITFAPVHSTDIIHSPSISRESLNHHDDDPENDRDHVISEDTHANAICKPGGFSRYGKSDLSESDKSRATSEELGPKLEASFYIGQTNLASDGQSMNSSQVSTKELSQSSFTDNSMKDLPRSYDVYENISTTDTQGESSKCLATTRHESSQVNRGVVSGNTSSKQYEGSEDLNGEISQQAAGNNRVITEQSNPFTFVVERQKFRFKVERSKSPSVLHKDNINAEIGQRMSPQVCVNERTEVNYSPTSSLPTDSLSASTSTSDKTHTGASVTFQGPSHSLHKDSPCAIEHKEKEPPLTHDNTMYTSAEQRSDDNLMAFHNYANINNTAYSHENKKQGCEIEPRTDNQLGERGMRYHTERQYNPEEMLISNSLNERKVMPVNGYGGPQRINPKGNIDSPDERKYNILSTKSDTGGVKTLYKHSLRDSTQQDNYNGCNPQSSQPTWNANQAVNLEKYAKSDKSNLKQTAYHGDPYVPHEYNEDPRPLLPRLPKKPVTINTQHPVSRDITQNIIQHGSLEDRTYSGNAYENVVDTFKPNKVTAQATSTALARKDFRLPSDGKDADTHILADSVVSAVASAEATGENPYIAVARATARAASIATASAAQSASSDELNVSQDSEDNRDVTIMISTSCTIRNGNDQEVHDSARDVVKALNSKANVAVYTRLAPGPKALLSKDQRLNNETGRRLKVSIEQPQGDNEVSENKSAFQCKTVEVTIPEGIESSQLAAMVTEAVHRILSPQRQRKAIQAGATTSGGSRHIASDDQINGNTSRDNSFDSLRKEDTSHAKTQPSISLPGDVPGGQQAYILADQSNNRKQQPNDTPYRSEKRINGTTGGHSMIKSHNGSANIDRAVENEREVNSGSTNEPLTSNRLLDQAPRSVNSGFQGITSKTGQLGVWKGSNYAPRDHVTTTVNTHRNPSRDQEDHSNRYVSEDKHTGALSENGYNANSSTHKGHADTQRKYATSTTTIKTLHDIDPPSSELSRSAKSIRQSPKDNKQSVFNPVQDIGSQKYANRDNTQLLNEQKPFEMSGNDNKGNIPLSTRNKTVSPKSDQARSKELSFAEDYAQLCKKTGIPADRTTIQNSRVNELKNKLNRQLPVPKGNRIESQWHQLRQGGGDQHVGGGYKRGQIAAVVHSETTQAPPCAPLREHAVTAMRDAAPSRQFQRPGYHGSLPRTFFYQGGSRGSLIETDLDTGVSKEQALVLETDLDRQSNGGRAKSYGNLDTIPTQDNYNANEKMNGFEKTQSMTCLARQQNKGQTPNANEIPANGLHMSENELRVRNSLSKLNVPDWYNRSSPNESELQNTKRKDILSDQPQYRVVSPVPKEGVSARIVTTKPVVIQHRVVTPIIRNKSPQPDPDNFQLPSAKWRQKESASFKPVPIKAMHDVSMYREDPSAKETAREAYLKLITDKNTDTHGYVNIPQSPQSEESEETPPPLPPRAPRISVNSTPSPPANQDTLYSTQSKMVVQINDRAPALKANVPSEHGSKRNANRDSTQGLLDKRLDPNIDLYHTAPNVTVNERINRANMAQWEAEEISHKNNDKYGPDTQVERNANMAFNAHQHTVPFKTNGSSVDTAMDRVNHNSQQVYNTTQSVNTIQTNIKDEPVFDRAKQSHNRIVSNFADDIEKELELVSYNESPKRRRMPLAASSDDVFQDGGKPNGSQPMETSFDNSRANISLDDVIGNLLVIPPSSLNTSMASQSHSRRSYRKSGSSDTSSTFSLETPQERLFQLLREGNPNADKSMDSTISKTSSTGESPQGLSPREGPTDVTNPRLSQDLNATGNSEDLVDDTQITVKCRNTKCKRTMNLRDAKHSYKTCHNCFTYYCSRECRKEHWERHKKKCVFSRVSSICKHVIKKIHGEETLCEEFSKVARTGFIQKGRGCVVVAFGSLERASNFLEKGIVSLQVPLAFVSMKEIEESQLFNDQLFELVDMCRTYNPEVKFVVDSIILSEQPMQGPMPRRDGLAIKKCAKLRLTNTQAPKQNRPVSIDESDTLILTAVPGSEFTENMEEKKAREICFANIQRKLRQRGVRLRHQFPEVYNKLCAYVATQEHFAPITLFPMDGNTGKRFMCLIMPNSEPEIEWLNKPDLLDELGLNTEV